VGLVALLSPGGTEVAPVAATAGCGVAWNVDCGLDYTVTSALDVSHVVDEGGYLTPVEPGSTETLTVTAYYQTPDDPDFPPGPPPPPGIPAVCRCNQLSTTVTAQLTWTGSQWTVSCTGCNSVSGPIYQLSICGDDDQTCTAGETGHSSGYRLLVDAARQWSRYTCPANGNPYDYLDRVTYSTSSIPNGSEIDMDNCTLGSSVIWTGSEDGATDYGSFECSFDCTATGASLTLLYE